jgi:hypothetical protein
MRALVACAPLCVALNACAQWSLVDGGIDNGQIHTMLYIEDSGALVVGGTSRFLSMDMVQINGIAYYNNGQWNRMGDGVIHPQNGQVPQVAALGVHNGSLLAGGAFFLMDSVPVTSFVSRWDGNSWHSMGIDSCCQESALIRGWSPVDNDAHLYGWYDWTVDSQVLKSWAVWDGAQWTPGDSNDLFPGFYTGSRQINALLDFEGRRIVGGNFQPQNRPNDLAVLNGSIWEELGVGIQGDAWVNDLAVFNDKLWVAGEFFSNAGNAATGLMTWDGTQWADPFPQIESTAAGLELLVAHDKLYFLGPFVAQGLPGIFRIAVFDGEQLCVIGTNELYQVRSLAASPDTLYAFVYPFDWDMQNIGQWPLNAPADTCYAIAQGLVDGPGPLRARELVAMPNPAAERVRFTWTGASSPCDGLVILDAAGRLVMLMPVSFSKDGWAELDVSRLEGGCYHARLEHRGVPVAWARFVKGR